MKEGQQPTPPEAFIKAIETDTGESVESIRNTPIDESRRRIEKKFGSPTRVVSYGPFVGRSGPSHLTTREEVNKLVDQALERSAIRLFFSVVLEHLTVILAKV